MIIDFEKIKEILSIKNIKINGIIHIGAHECEELIYYNQLGVKNEDIIWIDAIKSKVIEATNRGIPNVYNAVITDKDDEEMNFYIANNIQSSSILEFGTHSQEHPNIYFIDKINVRSISIDTFFRRNNIDASKINFWKLDIQGAELLALKGASQTLKYVDILYLKVNKNELYKNCALIADIDTYISQYGFFRVLTCMTQNGWGNAIYIKN